MKPFNLQAALSGAKVVTVSGESVTGLHLFDGVESPFCLYGVLEENLHSWSKDGRYTGNRITELDLRMAEDDQS